MTVKWSAGNSHCADGPTKRSAPWKWRASTALGQCDLKELPPILRSDNGLIFQSRRFRDACRFYHVPEEFITPYTSEQNGVIERWFRSLKEECVWQHQFRNFADARQAIRQWIAWYNTERPHQPLGYRSPHTYRQIHDPPPHSRISACARRSADAERTRCAKRKPAAQRHRTGGCRRRVVGLTDGGHYKRPLSRTDVR